MAQLEAIAYVSSAVGSPSEAELAALLESARAKNDEVGVTGVLLYHDGTFFQYFEGSPAAVEIVYERIRRSVMHHGIIELMRTPIDVRAFARWSMGFTRAPASTLLKLSHATWLAALAQHDESAAVPDGMSLLVQFWRSGVGSG